MNIGELIKDRIEELKKDRLVCIANPQYWRRLVRIEEQLEFNKKLYFDLVTIPGWRRGKLKRL